MQTDLLKKIVEYLAPKKRTVGSNTPKEAQKEE